MHTINLAIATISWARNAAEEAILRSALTQLASLSLPLYITDGGSSAAFVRFLHNLPGTRVLTANGLWPQVKSSLAAATAGGARHLLYTEPDKLEFFVHHLPALLQQTPAEGVLLAARSMAAFAGFPAFQQMTETTINRCCSEVIGRAEDYCYGPFLFNARLVPYLDALPDSCGWGWRPFVFAVAHRLKLPVTAFNGPFTCPADQQTDDSSERLYRMRQLAQNLDGLLLAATVPLQPGGNQ